MWLNIWKRRLVVEWSVCFKCNWNPHHDNGNLSLSLCCSHADILAFLIPSHLPRPAASGEPSSEKVVAHWNSLNSLFCKELKHNAGGTSRLQLNSGYGIKSQVSVSEMSTQICNSHLWLVLKLQLSSGRALLGVCVCVCAVKSSTLWRLSRRFCNFSLKISKIFWHAAAKCQKQVEGTWRGRLSPGCTADFGNHSGRWKNQPAEVNTYCQRIKMLKCVWVDINKKHTIIDK